MSTFLFRGCPSVLQYSPPPLASTPLLPAVPEPPGHGHVTDPPEGVLQPGLQVLPSQPEHAAVVAGQLRLGAAAVADDVGVGAAEALDLRDCLVPAGSGEAGGGGQADCPHPS